MDTILFVLLIVSTGEVYSGGSTGFYYRQEKSRPILASLYSDPSKFHSAVLFSSKADLDDYLSKNYVPDCILVDVKNGTQSVVKQKPIQTPITNMETRYERIK